MPTFAKLCHFLLAFIVVAGGGCTSSKDVDDDAKLIARFRSQRAVFDDLLQMMKVDSSLERIDHDWTEPDPPPISSERLSDYRQKLERIGCIRGFEHFRGKEGVTFLAAVSAGNSKGYYFSAVVPSPLVDDLDSYRRGRSRDFAAYRHIEGDWYLIYEYDH